MASIYNEAERVVIWLGPSTYDTDLIMNFMKKLEEESLRHNCNNWNLSNQGWADIWSFIQTGSSASLMYRQCEGLKSLLARSWFKRVWILQEVANARVAEIVCGTKSVSARIFALTPLLAGIVPDHHCQAVLDIMPGPSRKSSWWTQKRDLQTLLAKFGKSEASDPRDVIYALLGMSSDVSSSDSLKANYEESVQKAIQNTTFFLLRFPESGYPTYGFPTWTLQEFLENLNSLGNAVLEWAVKVGYEAVVRQLVGRGDVDINTKDQHGRTPLSTAVEGGYEAVVRQLVGHGDVDINTKDQHGRTPLSTAVEGGYEAIVRLLVGGGADINVKSTQGETALLQAVSKESVRMVRVLVDLGADINARDSFGKTALHQAAFRERDTMVRLLVGLGADINAKGRNGGTALYWAVFRGNDVIARLLIDLGADVNAKDDYGETALHWAAHTGNQTIAQLLVDNGADVNMRGNNGATALSMAALMGYQTIVQLLGSAGAS
ncbi:ankyrin repeat-containing domain protein [Hyaloscypha sp. PMI_1271]|nr:ankyrin repeat-containing domain protein [Hyaloscypha sp. PMI_1271]